MYLCVWVRACVYTVHFSNKYLEVKALQDFRQKLWDTLHDRSNSFVNTIKFATAAWRQKWTDTYTQKFHLFISRVCRCIILTFSAVENNIGLTSMQRSHPKLEARCLRVSPDHRANNKVADKYIHWRTSISNSILIPATLYCNSIIPNTYVTVLNHHILAWICLFHNKME